MLTTGLTGCVARSPRVAVGPSSASLGELLATHPPAVDQPLRADELARVASASYHLVQVRQGERPHRHRAHDLTVVLLRGVGRLRLGSRTIELRAGDVVSVPRGTVHWFTNTGSADAVALVMFSPPLDGVDLEPVVVDSTPGGS